MGFSNERKKMRLGEDLILVMTVLTVGCEGCLLACLLTCWFVSIRERKFVKKKDRVAFICGSERKDVWMKHWEDD